MDKVLISGYSGFVASNLAPYLMGQDLEVKGISRNKGEHTMSYDMLTRSEWNKTNVFIHLAGKAHDVKNTSDADAYKTVNTELSKTLFDQFLESNCTVFIYFSSVKAAADVVEGVLTEEVTPNPATPYGTSKLAAERYLLSKELPSDKRLYILRPCMIHGPGNKGNLTLLYNLIAKGIPYPLGSFENKRSFLSVGNLNFLVDQLIKKQPSSGIFNLADDDAISTKELVTLIGNSLDKRPLILSPPKGLVAGMARVGGFLRLPFSEEKVQKLTENYIVSNEKIKSILGVSLPHTTREGLLHTLASFKLRS
ncbi:MAG: NAD-dependent epimerase/dehydratase family protein [Bacteroidetes bacterium]|nr:NAD-dependent epimerase/dehydratase family protein [Bacteroidota bacterium]